jgi:tRNA pseudouridine55 synthase
MSAAGHGGPTPDGVLLLDKPAGITSTRALALAKRALGASKAGHTGTLDPFATGLLPLAFGEATKFSRFLIDAVKAYEATLQLGEETATGDTESPVVHSGGAIPDAAAIAEVVRRFVGPQSQVPPMHSAVHVGGRRLYEYAREGVEVAREARTIEVHALDILALEGNALVLSVRCSKGTYIRVLAADIGRALGCGAYLSALRRTAVGPFRLEEAVAMAELEACGPEKARGRLLPVDALVRELEPFSAGTEEALRFSHGRVIPGASPGADPVAVYAPGGRFLGVAEALPGGGLAPLRLMAERDEIP